MLKDIFIPMTGAPADSYALHIAAALAASYEANLTVVELADLPPPVTGPWDLTPAVGLQEMHDSLRARAQENAAKLRARLEQEPAVSEVRVVEALFSSPAEVAAHMAQCIDLSVLAGTAGSLDKDPTADRFFPALLFGSGRPVLVVPPGCKTPMPPRRIVIGWTPSPHAARAIHDALPLLREAELVDIVLIDAPAGEQADSQEPGREIAHFLAHHEVKTNLVTKQSHERPPSQMLIEHAQKVQAQLIVVGGYGHSRLREWALGGMTRELLFQSPLPVLYSH